MKNPLKPIADALKKRKDVKIAREEIRRTQEIQAEAKAPPFIDVIAKGDKCALLLTVGDMVMVYTHNFKIQAVHGDGEKVVLKRLRDMEEMK